MLKNCSKNYLLYLGTGIFLCTLIFKLYIGTDLESSRFQIKDNLFFVLIFAVFFAPFIEEFVFRGFLIKKKYEYFFYVGVPVFIIFSKNYYLIIIYLFVVIGSKKNNYTIILNAILFALVHYSFSDFNSIYKIIPMFYQFSLGLIFSWIIINFGIIKSILIHLVINFIILFPVFYALQFPEQRIQKVRYNNFELEWKKVPMFSIQNKSEFRKNEFSIIAKNYNLDNYVESVAHIRKSTIPFENKYFHYDFTVTQINSKDSTRLNAVIIENLLLQSKLIK